MNLNSNDKQNDDSVLSENSSQFFQNDSQTNKKLKRPVSILKSSKNSKKLMKNDSDSMISSKKQDESTIDMLNDETLDGFSIEDNTVLSETNGIPEDNDDDLSQDSNNGSQSVVKFNLKDTQQEMSENSVSQKAESIGNNKKRKRRGSAFYVDHSIASQISASQLFVYKWPQDEPGCELFMLQEQVSDYLEIKSFKRKYPDLYRRPIEMKEREYLKDNKIVSETQCDLGLTALKLSDVLLIMSQEYPDKYKEFNSSLNEKRKAIANAQSIKKKSETIKTNKIPDGSKLKEMIKKAVKSASEYNSQLQKEKKDERNTFFDLHTMRIHVPLNNRFQLNKKLTKPGSYPVPLIPGQYQDYYKKYSSDELKYLPINTIMYSLPKPQEMLYWDWKNNAYSVDAYEYSSDDEEKIDNFVNNKQSAVENNIKPIISKTESSTMAICYVCQKSSTSDQMVHCSSCPHYSHQNCLELNPNLVNWNCIRNYNWQCMECKICSTCNQANDEDKMMFCDRCDRGFHTYCVGVKEVPSGSWICITCKSNDNTLNLNNSSINNNSLNTSVKSTPVKMKINAILSQTNPISPNSTPSKRGRPLGSLNKPKISQQAQSNVKEINNKSLKDVTQKNKKILVKELVDTNLTDTPDTKKSRGRPRKTNLDNIHELFNGNSATTHSNTNSKDFLLDQDDDHSLNNYNITNTCVIDDNISSQFNALN